MLLWQRRRQVVAVTKAGELLLVRQFRPARGEASLELVSGHVEIGETPEEAARKAVAATQDAAEKAKKSAEVSISANVEATKKAAVEAKEAMVKAAGDAADAARAAADAARESWEKNTGNSSK